MTQTTITWPVSKDALVAQNIADNTSYGAGKCLHNPVGRSIAGYGPVRHRSFLDFTEDWTGAVQIVKAELKMRRPTSGNATHVNVGASAYVRAQRAAAAWSEGSKGADEFISETNAIEWSNQPGVVGTASPAKVVPAAGEWISVDITVAIEEIAPPAVKLRNGTAGTGSGTWEGLRIIATDSGGTEQNDVAANASEFYSMQSSSDPYVLLTVDDNQAPAVPTITTPEADAVHSSTLGTTATITGTYSDPDGNPFAGGTLQVYNDAATDDGAGNILTGTQLGSNTTMIASDGSGGSWSKQITGLPAQTFVKVRAQVKDNNGAYSIYSPLRRFKTNAAPKTPTNPYFQDDTVTSPAMAASLDDPDSGAYITAYEPEVYYDHPTLGAITYWAPGKTSVGGASTRASFTYNGTQLVVGTKYRWRIRLYDNNDVASPWTADLYVIPRNATGPSNMTPRDVETKQNTRTPSLSINHSANFDQYKLQVYSNAEGTGTPLWDVPTQTVASTATVVKTYGDNTGLTGASTAVALDWGRRYYWRAAVRITGNSTIGEFSPLYPFYVNALPAAPTVTVSV